MRVDIKSLMEATLLSTNQLKSLNELAAASSFAATHAAQQAYLRMTEIPTTLSAIDSFLKRAEDEAARYRKLQSPAHLHIGQLMASEQARALKMADFARMEPSVRRTVEQLDRISAYARASDHFQNIIDRMESDRASRPDWLVNIEVSQARARRMIADAIGPGASANSPDWSVLNQGLGDVEAAIHEIPARTTSVDRAEDKPLSAKQYVAILIALASLLFAILSYLETVRQGSLSRSEAAEVRSQAERDLKEEREFRERVVASLELLAQRAAEPQVFVVGSRGAKLKSAISGGSAVCTLDPGRRVYAIERQGRWIKVHCLDENDLEGWTPKRNLIRQ